MSRLNVETLNFVKEGVFKASVAYETIRYFENSLIAIWNEALNEATCWNLFSPDLKKIKYSYGLRPANFGKWMVGIITGKKLDGNVQREFEIGFSAMPSPRFYVAWKNEPKYFEYDNKVEEIQFDNSWATILYKEPLENDDFDIKAIYKTLIEELIRYA